MIKLKLYNSEKFTYIAPQYIMEVYQRESKVDKKPFTVVTLEGGRGVMVEESPEAVAAAVEIYFPVPDGKYPQIDRVFGGRHT